MTHLLGCKWQRRVGQTRDGSDAPDIEPAGGGQTWLWPEVKRQTKGCSPHAALKQAEEAIGVDFRYPIALTRNDHAPWVFSCYATDLQWVVEELIELGLFEAGEEEE